jgi:transcriptional regulator MraZ
LTFRGTYEHTLDAKHRLTIPSKFRGQLAGGVVLAASHEVDSGSPRTIGIWTPDAYDAFTAATLAGMNPLSPQARELKRFFFNASFDTDLDSANRVMIPPHLMGYAELDREVVVTGSGECLEIWDRARYAQNFEQIVSRISDIAASLGDTA